MHLNYFMYYIYKMSVLDTIPSHKLYNVINVSLRELNEYEIYTGVGGNGNQ